jgi:hypothetical protein
MLKFLPHRYCSWSLALILLLATAGAAALALRWAPWEPPTPADESNSILDLFAESPVAFVPPGNPRDQEKGPSLQGGVAWLNTASPLNLSDLRGRVVVLDFWTLC